MGPLLYGTQRYQDGRLQKSRQGEKSFTIAQVMRSHVKLETHDEVDRQTTGGAAA